MTQPVSTRQLLYQFALAATVVVIIVAGVTVWATRRLALRQALRDAGQNTAEVGELYIQPSLPPVFDAGASDPALDHVVRQSVLSDRIVHVRVWDRQGQILYSDQDDLIGSVHDLDAAAIRAFRTGLPESKVSDPEREANEGITNAIQELEVYYRITDRSGNQLLFETYQPYAAVGARSTDLFTTMVPLALGTIFGLFSLQLPLTYLLVRRLDQAQTQERLALRSSIAAAEQERLVIATDLHDGTVQDLAGISMSLAVLGDRAERQGNQRDSEVAHHAATATRRAVRSLRSLLVDIYPPNLDEIGLRRAVADLASENPTDTATISVDIESGLSLPKPAVALAYRTIRELLRNARHHAEASTIDISVRCRDDLLHIAVIDNGKGLAATAASATDTRPRLGLRSLSDLLSAAGGNLDLQTPQTGTGLIATARVPVT